MRRVIVLGVLAAVTFVIGCASAGSPPGGPERHEPPQIVAISPDSSSTGVNIREVEFKFDEVVSDRPSGASATNLDQVFLISPRDGAPNVGWHRSRITVRPRKGFRANTAYRVTMLPGIADLRGNVRKEPVSILFSTGGAFPPFNIVGRVFDWTAGRVATGAYIEAISRADTTLVYVAASDSLGQFEVGPLAAGTYLVRGLIDANSNRAIDRNEKWDSTTVVVSTTSPSTELDAVERDSVPPVFDNISLDDSVHLRVTFDKALLPGLALTPAILSIKKSDSTSVPITGLDYAGAYDRGRLARDSARKADSLKADSVTRRLVARPAPPPVAITPGGPRPAPPPPKPKAPAPERGIIITVATPFVVNSTYRVSATGFKNLVGHSRDITRTFTVPKPAPKTPADTSRRAPTDTTRRPPPMRRERSRSGQ